jgi:haloacetate dehalogenase
VPWVNGPVNHRIIASGHHQAEEAPEAVAEAIRRHLLTAGLN